MCFSNSVILRSGSFASRRTVPSLSLSVRTVRFLSSRHVLQADCGSVASCPSFAFRKHKLSFPRSGNVSRHQLTSCWQGCASRRMRRTLPRRKLMWTWSSSVAVDTRHVPSISAALAGGVNSLARGRDRSNFNGCFCPFSFKCQV